jgi:hypothetical protein
VTNWDEFKKYEENYTLSPHSAWETSEVYHRGYAIGTIQAVSEPNSQETSKYLVLMRGKHKSGKMITQILGLFETTEKAFQSIKLAHFTEMYKW